MLAFEILVNGKSLCIAGTAPNAVLSTILSWSRRHPERLNFHVGGIPGDDSTRHFEWETPRIEIGDEVLIRVIEADTCDEPDCIIQLPRRNHEGPVD